MEKFIAKTFTRWFYIQLPNKKFFKIESALLYMIVSCLILGHGVMNFAGITLLPFMIPFIFGGLVMFNGSSLPYWIVKDNETGKYKFKHYKFQYFPFVTPELLGEMGYWRTQLMSLKAMQSWGQELTDKQKETLVNLDKIFELEHGVKHSNFKEARLTKFMPWLLPIGLAILALLS
jgi:hypothetical protein